MFSVFLRIKVYRPIKNFFGQRSRSASDGYRNFVTTTAPEPLKGFVSKLLKTLRIVGPTGAVLDRIFIFVVSNPSIYTNMAAANCVVITNGGELLEQPISTNHPLLRH